MPLIKQMRPELPVDGDTVVLLNELQGCADSLLLAEAIASHDRLFLIVTRDTQDIVRLEQELLVFLDPDYPVLPFPDWETLVYDVFSPLPEIVSQRIRTLASLPRTSKGALIVTVASLMQRLAPREHILGNTFHVRVGDVLSLDQTRIHLERFGYQAVPQVREHGEFAVRGSILDLFPMASAVPYRIELFDEEVESIRTFEPDSQRSAETVEKIEFYPAREFPFDEEAIRLFRRNYRTQFPNLPHNNALYSDVSKGIASSGIEYYLPLFVEKTETLFDYLPAKCVLVEYGDIQQAARAFFDDTGDRQQLRRCNIDRPALPVEALFLAPQELDSALHKHSRIRFRADLEMDDRSDSHLFQPGRCPALPPLALDSHQVEPSGALKAFLEDFKGRVLLTAESLGRREALLASLQREGIRPTPISSWAEFLRVESSLCMMVAYIDRGLVCPDAGLAIITETQLSGQKAQQRRRRRSASRDLMSLMQNLEELRIGSPVVHKDHGVGRYLGLQTLTVGGNIAEFLTLEYANGDKLYVPVSSLHLVGRYSGAAEAEVPLHKLGGEVWRRAKRRAFERARDVAAELLEIYAKREAREGFAFNTFSGDYAAFAADFPFEETPDQEIAITEVLKDMASTKPMDRVICGDVGFGKTEVAMRAAFVAAHNGKQVAVLVPTTLLAQQHFQNFRDRFANWPLRVEVMSRFVGKKQQDEFMEGVGNGKIDILIGTHKLLQKNIQFKNLGLVIIDEEHRFGVHQKEHFKHLRSEVDILTLTATPIPRTLNMALGGLRDISIIATPPPNRHAIQTFVSEWSDGLVQEAVLREIRRGGQVYFLHNKIETMEKMARDLGALIPQATIRWAHGQMPERELEQIMLDFYHQRFNLLLSTTIIESGIDVPTANTIIINRADQLGLAQLHQLRGRVGRSHHRAYAYLLVPPKPLITSDAAKRLEAIEASGELGGGFLISSHDMEIRGAGELLGDEQSGQIEEVGFSLYAELLDRAVTAMRTGNDPKFDVGGEGTMEIDLQISALIPDSYLPDVHGRLVLYKRLAGAKSEQELDTLQAEMIDRFGLLPPAAKNLFALAGFRLRAGLLDILKIEMSANGGRLHFKPKPRVEPLRVIELIQRESEVFRLEGADKIRFNVKLESAEARISFIEDLLQRLQG